MKRINRAISLTVLALLGCSCVNIDIDLSGYEMNETILPGLDVAFERDTIKMTFGDMMNYTYGIYSDYTFNVSLAKHSELYFEVPLAIFTEFDVAVDNLVIYGKVYNDLPFTFDILPRVDFQPGVFAAGGGPILASLDGSVMEQDFEISFDFEEPISRVGYLRAALSAEMVRDENFIFPHESGSLKILLQGARLKKGVNVNITFI